MRTVRFFLFVVCGVFVFGVLPSAAWGALMVNEIAWMGSNNGGTATQDANDEWIELANTGSSEASLIGWRLAADDGAPDILLSGAIAAGGFFLLERTDDGTVPGISADLIYAGALSNGGETLRLYDAAGSVVETLNFGAGWPAGDNATKATMQRVGSQWITAAGTPRAANSSSDETAGEADTAPPPVETDDSSGAGIVVSAEESAKKTISAAITTTLRRATVGAPFAVGGMGYGVAGEPLKNVRYLWSFGDGGRAEGQSVAHTFRYPGKYIVALDIASGEYAASDRMVVEAAHADVVVSRIGAEGDHFIEIENRSPSELDLSGWLLKSGAQYFSIPHSTFIAPNSKLIFPASITGLEIRSREAVALLYPDGTTAHAQDEKSVVPAAVPFSPSASGNQTVSSVKTLSVPRANSASAADAASAGLSAASSEKEAIASPEAAVGRNGGDVEKSNMIFPWLIAAALLVITAIAAFFTLPRRSEAERAAEQFTIIEDKTP